MHVCYISNFHEISGWSYQAANHILALDAAGCSVIPRRLNITETLNPNIHPRILELEKNLQKKVDIVILNTLPSLYERIYPCKTIGYYMVETDTFKNSGWPGRINMMDAALVSCYENKQASIKSGVTVPLYVVPVAIDVEKCIQQYPINSTRKDLGNDKFIFYVVAEWTTRKNIEAILRAFHTEFSLAEPVELLIKTTPVGMSNPQVDINNRINTIKENLKLYKSLDRYKKENIICGYLSEDDMYSLHHSCDCYVAASRGESFNISLAEAMAVGNICIGPSSCGMDYLTEKNSYVVDSKLSSCFAARDTLPNLYVGSENWWEPNILSLRQCMRNAYTKRDLNKKKIAQARLDIKKFSIGEVGQVYRKVLEKIL